MDLERYRTGELPMADDFVKGHGHDVVARDTYCTTKEGMVEAVKGECVKFRGEWQYAARFDLVFRPVRDTPEMRSVTALVAWAMNQKSPHD